MPTFALVDECDQHPGVKQDRRQRPNPSRCFLLEPRSGIPELTLPAPMTFRFLPVPLHAASTRSPSRTVLDALQPKRRIRPCSAACDSRSSLAWTFMLMPPLYYKVSIVLRPTSDTVEPERQNESAFIRGCFFIAYTAESSLPRSDIARSTARGLRCGNRRS